MMLLKLLLVLVLLRVHHSFRNVPHHIRVLIEVRMRAPGSHRGCLVEKFGSAVQEEDDPEVSEKEGCYLRFRATLSGVWHLADRIRM